MAPNEPETPEQWQRAVDAANALLAIHTARHYGLITGGPTVDLDRCEDVLTRGAARGVHPGQDTAERYAVALMDEDARRRYRGGAANGK